jgi:hypothetical protein
MEIATKPLVIASEIAGLAPLAAYIKQENRVMPVRFRLAKKRARRPEFVERKMPEGETASEPKSPATVLVEIPAPKKEANPKPVTAAQAVFPAVPKKPAAAQSAFPLLPESTGQAKAAFVWEELKGID